MAEIKSETLPMKYADKTYGTFLIMLKVESVVALYSESVLSFILIELKFPKTLCNEDLKINDKPPIIKPIYGDNIRVKAINKPTITIKLFIPNIFLK